MLDRAKGKDNVIGQKVSVHSDSTSNPINLSSKATEATQKSIIVFKG